MPAAMAAFEELYRASEQPASRAEALRRKAEVQAFHLHDLIAALDTCSRLLREVPGDPLPPASVWTYRTCGPDPDTATLLRRLVRNFGRHESHEAVKSIFLSRFGGLLEPPKIEACLAELKALE